MTGASACSAYLRNARRADIEYNGHDRNSPLDGGPIARRLKEYWRVKAFVVGPRAEMGAGERRCDWNPSRRTGGGRVRSRVVE